MGLIDWQRYAPVAPIGLGSGLSALSDALDQIAQQRAAKQKWQAEQDAKLAEQLRIEEDKRITREEVARHNQATEAQAAAAEARQAQGQNMEAIGKMAPYLQQGQGTLARMYAPFAQGPAREPTGNELVADLLGSTLPPQGAPPPQSAPPAAPPAVAPPATPDPLSVSPPPWTGNGPPPLTQPAPATQPDLSPHTETLVPPRPTLDLVDATMGRIEAEKKAKQASDLEEWKAAMAADAKTSPLAQSAFDYAVRAGTGGQLGKEALQKVYADRRQFLEAQAGLDRRAIIAGQVKPKDKVDNERALANSAATLLGQELGREDYKKQIADMKDTQSIIDDLGSGNAAAQRGALGKWAKLKAGPGTVQQQERDYFVNTVGGKDMALRQAAADLFNGGKVPEAQLKIFADAAKNIELKRQRQDLQNLRTSVRATFAEHPNPEFRQYADWAADRVGMSVLGSSKEGKKEAVKKYMQMYLEGQ